ncbi:hypothetical protein HID58_065244 [Brassica napus]|uniref:Protein kinase domain-containing protein n=1 Tax=Brassica napus TaxID=3708 RepID=A0ABQ7ZC83_BRANA|nr:hypothetical protein HID58_065244 [Brassica napus]
MWSSNHDASGPHLLCSHETHGSLNPHSTAILESSEAEGGGVGLDKSFGFSKSLSSKVIKKGQQVAVKVILKEKMKTAIAIEDVSREVKILRALSGHDDLLYFYDAY